MRLGRFFRFSVIAMNYHTSYEHASRSDAGQAALVLLPPSPCAFYSGKFYVERYPNDTWRIRHRDSYGSVLLSRNTSLLSLQQQWVVSSSLFSGPAYFMTLRDAESFIATFLRLTAMNESDYGDGRTPVDHADT